jgi:hypothetical protein
MKRQNWPSIQTGLWLWTIEYIDKYKFRKAALKVTREQRTLMFMVV